MGESPDPRTADDEQQLRRLGYAQELKRRMGGFSNYAISLSIICILAGGVTSFHLGICAVGGAAVGIGWPVGCLFSLAVAAAMAQIASAFPTAGGLYHWAAVLGGKGWGWAVAWLNLAGLVTVLAAINAGAWDFTVGALDLKFEEGERLLGLLILTATQALINHCGIRATTLLTDFSGWWILVVAAALTAAMLLCGEHLAWDRLVTFTNYSGPAGGDKWPRLESLAWLFALGLLLPAYTITGFDASAHTAEETVGAAVNVPRGIVRSVLVSGVAGWIMLGAVVVAVPDLDAVAAAGDNAFVTALKTTLPPWLAVVLIVGIAVAQYLCGLATVTSASRMLYAFARDGGVPGSDTLRTVSQAYQTPVYAVWAVALAAVLFTAYSPVYATISICCTVLLYLSYGLPIALGWRAYGRTWTRMGPWQLGRAFPPLALVTVLGCAVLVVLGTQPPYELAGWTAGGFCLVLLVAWFGGVRKRFRGPPVVKV